VAGEPIMRIGSLKTIIVGAALSLSSMLVASQESAHFVLPEFSCDRTPLFIRNIDVFEGGGQYKGRDVMIVDGFITRIEWTGEMRVPKGVRVLDADGAVMIPGFVDAHAHFVFPGAMGSRKRDPVQDALTFGRQMLAGGVTSARIHLDTIEHGKLLLALSQNDCAPMPRLQLGGPAFIPGTGDRPEAPVWDVTGVEDARTKVRLEHGAGFRWIAIHDAHKFPDDARAAIVDTARQLGMRILASGWSPDEVASSLALQPDTLDYLETSPAPEYEEATLKQIRSRRPQLIWVVRLGIHERFRAYQENPSLIEDPENYEFFDADTADELRAAVQKAVADRGSEHSKRMDAAYPTMARKFEQAIEDGGFLAMGTDAGSPAQFHRNAMWWEINAWVSHGVRLDEALSYASSGGARALRDPTVGKLEVGMRADFQICPQAIWNPRRPVRFSECVVYRAGVRQPKSR
jgi:cytosine/adenosine deaminase-related metal-dependent hydrolase